MLLIFFGKVMLVIVRFVVLIGLFMVEVGILFEFVVIIVMVLMLLFVV